MAVGLTDKVVVILGAGASAQLNLPIMAGFMNRARRLYQNTTKDMEQSYEVMLEFETEEHWSDCVYSATRRGPGGAQFVPVVKLHGSANWFQLDGGSQWVSLLESVHITAVRWLAAMRCSAGIEGALVAKCLTHLDPDKRHPPMKRILLSAVVFTSLVFAGMATKSAQAQSPYRRIACAAPQVIIVNGGGYGGYNAYSAYSGYGYGNYGTYGYVSPNYGLSNAP
jgi:hypothetical protein